MSASKKFPTAKVHHLSVPRLFTLFICAFFAGSYLALTTIQRPLTENDPSSKIMALQSSLKTRMAQHQRTMTKHLEDITPAVEILSYVAEKSSYVQFLKTELKTSPLEESFKSLRTILGLAGRSTKTKAQKNTETIKQKLSLMAKEMSDVEVFMLDVERELATLDEQLLKTSKSVDHAVQSHNVKIDLVTSVVKKLPMSDEQKIILGIFTDFLTTPEILAELNPFNVTRGSSIVGHARFEALFNSTFALNNKLMDYSCDIDVQVKFDPKNIITEVVYEKTKLDCMVLAPENSVGSIGKLSVARAKPITWLDWAPQLSSSVSVTSFEVSR